MNVTHVAKNAPSLERAKLSQNPLRPTRWSDTLNDAAAARDPGRPKALDPNRAILTTAQKALARSGLNGKTGVSSAHGVSGVGEGRVRTAQIAKASTPTAAVADKTIHAEPDATALEEKSQMLVNQFFMGSMLKQMRESPFKTETFSGGKAGEAYAGMFDSHLAEHAGNKLAKSLVRSMVKSYQKHAQPAAGISA